MCERWRSQLPVSLLLDSCVGQRNRSIYWSSRRKKDWSVVCSWERVNWNATRPRLLANYFAGARGRLAVREIWCGNSHFKGWETTRRGESSRVPCSARSFPPSAAHPHQSLRSPLDFLVPPSFACIFLTTRKQVSFVSAPTPSLVFGWSPLPIQQDLGTHPHLNRYC